MQVDLLVHPVGHSVAAWVMLGPVRSYVSGTISGSKPCWLSSAALGHWGQRQPKHGCLSHRFFCFRVKGEKIVQYLKI
jgi:hypothetical protein